jgi:molybdenum cofactor cytidylyltransferase
MQTDEIGILILAAGSSSRMGMSKQMLPVGGTSLLGKTITAALQAKFTNIIVVLGSNADEHRIAANEFPVTTLMNSDWQKGMGTSIKVGLNYFRETSIKGIIILVCDQPTLSSEILINLVLEQRKSKKAIIACRYARTLGVPALFMADTFQKLLALQDEHGAKKIILENQDDVSSTAFPSGEIDLDTPEDYDNFIKTYKA